MVCTPIPHRKQAYWIWLFVCPCCLLSVPPSSHLICPLVCVPPLLPPPPFLHPQAFKRETADLSAKRLAQSLLSKILSCFVAKLTALAQVC